MRKLTIIASLLFVATLSAQTTTVPASGTARRIVRFTGAPATCSAGYKYYDITTDNEWTCNNAGVWVNTGTGAPPGYPLLAPDGTAAAPSYSFTNNADMGLFRSAANLIGISVAGVEQWDFSQTCFCPTTNNTEDIGNGAVNPRDINLARNVNAAGIVSSGDGSVSAASFQFASQAGLGLYRRGAGQLGITTGSNIGWFDSTGYHAFGTMVEAFNDIGITSTDGVVLTTNGAASAGAQDFSPRLRFTGAGWRTDATAESQMVDWIVENQPVQGTASPSSLLVFSSQINAGGYTRRAALSSGGQFVLNNGASAVYLDSTIDGGVVDIYRLSNTAALRIYNSRADGSNYSRYYFGGDGTGLQVGTYALGTGILEPLRLATGGTVALNVSTGQVVTLPPQALTGGTMTAGTEAALRDVTTCRTWTNAMVAALAGTAGDVPFGTLPAKTKVLDATIIITGAATGPATVTVALGRVSAGYIDYIVASDAKAAANTVYGDASGERGTNLTGYDLPSYTGTTVINAHFISTGADLSTVTGSTGQVCVTTRRLP